MVTFAESDFPNILNYLNQEWKKKVAADFIDLVDSTIYQISRNRYKFHLLIKEKGFVRVSLTKHDCLYRDKTSTVEMLRI